MPSNMSVNLTNTAAVVTATQQGGQGTPETPFQWSVIDGKPLFAQITIHSYKRVVKGVDQIVHKYRVPYTVTNSTTTEVEPVAFAACTVTYDLPRNVPQSVLESITNLASSSESWEGTLDSNLRTPTQNRQAG